MQLEWYLAYVLMLLLLLIIINNSISMDIIETPIDPPLLRKRRIPWWLIGKESACQAGDTSSILG